MLEVSREEFVLGCLDATREAVLASRHPIAILYGCGDES